MDADQLGLVVGARQGHAADRHHHGAAGALQDAASHQHVDVGREAAQHRAQGEDADRRGEDAPRAEAVGHPAADRDEDGKAQRIARQHRLHAERHHVHRPGDGRHRGVEDGRIERLHEERHGDQPRQPALDGIAWRSGGCCSHRQVRRLERLLAVGVEQSAEEFGDHLAAAFAVCHQHRTEARIGGEHQQRAKAGIDAVVVEIGWLGAARLHEDASSRRPVADLGRQGPRRRTLHQAALAPARRNRQGQARQLGGRAPQPCGCMFGVDVEATGQGVAEKVVRRSCVAFRRRQRLEEAAAHHPDRRQHELARKLVEFGRGGIHHQALQHHGAAAGVAERLSRRPRDTHRWRVGGRCAVENLQQRRQRDADGIAREARHRGAAAMAEQQARRDGLRSCAGQCPRAQHLVHWRIEAEATLFDQAQHGDGRHHLADRGCLEECLRVGADGGKLGDLAIPDQRHAGARHAMPRQQRAEQLTSP